MPVTFTESDFETDFNAIRQIDVGTVVLEGESFNIEIDIVVQCDTGGDQTLLKDSTFTYTEAFINGVCP